MVMLMLDFKLWVYVLSTFNIIDTRANNPGQGVSINNGVAII